MTEAINYSDELLDHLATENALVIFKEGLDPEVLPEDCVDERRVLVFTMDFIEQYGSAPGPRLLTEEFGITFEEPTTNVEWLLEKLRERYKRNEAQKVILRVSRQLGENPTESIEEAIAGLSAITSKTIKTNTSFGADDWEQVVSNYRAKVLAGSLQGITFGFPEMDEVLGGHRPDTQTFVVGRPKDGKSWMQVSSLVEAFLAGERCTLHSLELSHQEMYERIMAQISGVSYSRLMKGVLLKDEQEALNEGAEVIAELRKHGADFKIHAPRGGATVREMVQQADDDGATIHYIDQLSWIRHHTFVKPDLRHREIGYILQDLKSNAHKRPQSIAAQFNRQATGLGEMADLSKIGLSDEIGQIADLVLGLYRDKEMIRNRLFQFGAVAGRAFEPGVWEFKNNLSEDSSFKLLRRCDVDD